MSIPSETIAYAASDPNRATAALTLTIWLAVGVGGILLAALTLFVKRAWDGLQSDISANRAASAALLERITALEVRAVPRMECADLHRELSRAGEEREARLKSGMDEGFRGVHARLDGHMEAHAAGKAA